MLNNSKIITQVPITDLARAKKFYSEMLGFNNFQEETAVPGVCLVKSETGSEFLLFSRKPTTADHAIMAFVVDDVEETIAELTAKGVVFEQYDLGFTKTDFTGLAIMGPAKVAWFKDSEGNLLSLNNKM